MSVHVCSHYQLKMTLSGGFWVWDEPTDDVPPCPHSDLVPVPLRLLKPGTPHRPRAPNWISPFKTPCPWYLSIFAPTPGLFSPYPPIPWGIAPKFEYKPRAKFVPTPRFTNAPPSRSVPYTALAPTWCYAGRGYWPFLNA